MSGLIRGPVQRLTNTRKSLSEDCRRILGEIERLCDHKALRDELTNATLPCIPYLGLYLNDLTFLYDTGYDYNGPLIEWKKHEMAAELLTTLFYYQEVPYTFTSTPLVPQKIENYEFFGVEELQLCSQYLEPGNGNKPQCLFDYQEKLKNKKKE